MSKPVACGKGQRRAKSGMRPVTSISCESTNICQRLLRRGLSAGCLRNKQEKEKHDREATQHLPSFHPMWRCRRCIAVKRTTERSSRIVLVQSQTIVPVLCFLERLDVLKTEHAGESLPLRQVHKRGGHDGSLLYVRLLGGPILDSICSTLLHPRKSSITVMLRSRYALHNGAGWLACMLRSLRRCIRHRIPTCCRHPLQQVDCHLKISGHQNAERRGCPVGHLPAPEQCS